MTIEYSDKIKNGIVEGAAAKIELGGGQVKIIIYAGTVPAGIGTALSGQTVISQHDMDGNAFEDVGAVGLLNANAFPSAIAQNNGAPSFFRMIDGQGEVCMQGTAGTSGDLVTSAANYESGKPVSFTTCRLRAA